MKKRFCSVFIILALLGAICTPVYANQIEPRESYVFAGYWITGHQGTNQGEVGVTFSVTCSHFTSVIGVSSIEIYKTDATHMHTEVGTVENGFLRNGGNCVGTYIYQGVSGEKYYAVVNFYGVADGITETRTLVTGTITAP